MATAKQPAAKLITMVFLKPYGRYSRTDRAGFPEDKAKQLKDRKIAIPASEQKAADAEKAKAAGENKPAKGTEGADKV
ncbi:MULTISPECIES: hypothetical protein [Halomonadaceae]|uniref:Uncharacterized protein n=1 Tax=Vreelandella titanicae TaxID=664683 RepID=A0AAP9NLZ7_9GAMM|nr:MULTISPECIES: hypothetical protein [Halomonas]QKS24191.1 hypothetical protein FX987_01965 [Halomonas titanicae]CDG54565.1 hypothetical protein HALA3H3_790044 [Halomonas sp. A3H3]